MVIRYFIKEYLAKNSVALPMKYLVVHTSRHVAWFWLRNVSHLVSAAVFKDSLYTISCLESFAQPNIPIRIWDILQSLDSLHKIPPVYTTSATVDQAEICVFSTIYRHFAWHVKLYINTYYLQHSCELQTRRASYQHVYECTLDLIQSSISATNYLSQGSK